MLGFFSIFASILLSAFTIGPATYLVILGVIICIVYLGSIVYWHEGSNPVESKKGYISNPNASPDHLVEYYKKNHWHKEVK